MLKGRLISLIRDALGFHESLEIGVIHRHMDRIQEMFEKPYGRYPLPWFLFNATQELKTTQGIDYVDLPEGFIQMDDEDQWRPFVALEYERGYLEPSLVQETHWGRPMNFELIEDGKLYLSPTPDDEYTIIFPHYARSPAFSGTGENPWYTWFPELIRSGTVWSIARAIRDEAAMKISEQEFSIARDEYNVTIESRRHNLVEEVIIGAS